MCPKPISAQAGKGGSACSGPRTIYQYKNSHVAGQGTPHVPLQAFHTILLYSTPTHCAQVCTVAHGVSAGLCAPTGVHQTQLRRAFTSGRVGRYEWQDGPRMLRTTLLPLLGKDGKPEEVLSVTRDISWWGTFSNMPALHEGNAPKTFAQLLLAARETEKREVAKALHDEIGTASVMLSALVSIAKQSVQKGNNQQALKDLERLQTQTQESIERLRNIIVTLRPPSLETDGALRGSIEELIKDVCSLGRLKYRFVCAKTMNEKGISDRVKILLYRLVQEALSNIVKHAHATCVTVQVKRVKDKLYVTVQDDGIGFIPGKRTSINHVGLRSMQDSVRLLGGELKISSTPGHGTQIYAEGPCVIYEEGI